MVEYSYNEAIELLSNNKQNAETALKKLEEYAITTKDISPDKTFAVINFTYHRREYLKFNDLMTSLFEETKKLNCDLDNLVAFSFLCYFGQKSRFLSNDQYMEGPLSPFLHLFDQDKKIIVWHFQIAEWILENVGIGLEKNLKDHLTKFLKLIFKDPNSLYEVSNILIYRRAGMEHFSPLVEIAYQNGIFDECITLCSMFFPLDDVFTAHATMLKSRIQRIKKENIQ